MSTTPPQPEPSRSVEIRRPGPLAPIALTVIAIVAFILFLQLLEHQSRQDAYNATVDHFVGEEQEFRYHLQAHDYQAQLMITRILAGVISDQESFEIAAQDVLTTHDDTLRMRWMDADGQVLALASPTMTHPLRPAADTRGFRAAVDMAREVKHATYTPLFAIADDSSAFEQIIPIIDDSDVYHGALVLTYIVPRYLQIVIDANTLRQYRITIFMPDGSRRHVFGAPLNEHRSLIEHQSDFRSIFRASFAVPHPPLPANLVALATVSTVLLIGFAWAGWSQRRALASEKTLRKALEQSEMKYRELVESVNDVVHEQDDQGRLTYIGPMVEQLAGYHPDEVIGRPFTDFIHPDDIEGLREDFHATLRGRIAPAEYRILAKDGHAIWVRSSSRPIERNGQTIGLRGIITDISDMKVEQEAREYQTHVLRTILDNIADGVVVADPEGQFTLFNHAAQQLVPLPDPDVPLEQWPTYFNVYHPGEDRRLNPQELPLIRAIHGERVDNFELELRPRSSGAHRYLLCSARPIRDEDETPLGGVVVFRDVTEERERQIRVRERRGDLSRAERIQMLGEIAAGLAHEINQPLCAIVNYTQALVRLNTNGGIEKAKLDDVLQQLVSEAQRASSIIRRIQSFARPDKSEPAAININASVREICQILEGDMRDRKVRLSLDLAPNLPLADAASLQIEQVLLNLLRNAIDSLENFAADDRFITISTTLQPDLMIRVQIVDSGAGIDADASEQIFEPFYTTKRMGMGIGLSISRTIIERLGGTLGFSSNEVAGTTFWFTIPSFRGATNTHEARSRPHRG